MAWKTPAGQKKRQNPPPKKNKDASFPGLQTTRAEEPDKTHYEELQQNEVMVLQAIYGDDFIEQKAAHSAWKVFLELHIRRGLSTDQLAEIRAVLRHTHQVFNGRRCCPHVGSCPGGDLP
jgi:hypothetical protein